MRRSRGVTLVEFALVAPTAFLLLLGTIVLAIIGSTQVALSNGVRDGARAAAICGSDTTNDTLGSPYTTDSSTTSDLPNGNVCTHANLDAYIKSRLPASCPPSNCTVYLTLEDGASTPTALTPSSTFDSQYLSGACNTGNTASGKTYIYSDSNTPYIVLVHATYVQDLYVPFIGVLLGNNGSTSTRTMTADATATCEQ